MDTEIAYPVFFGFHIIELYRCVGYALASAMLFGGTVVLYSSFFER